MANLKFRYLIVVILLALTAFVVYNLRYDSSQDDETGLADLQAIPMQIGKWKGQDVSLDEMVYDILETRAIIHRSFNADNEGNVFLSVVHYNDTKVDFHAPEACIGGRGFKTQKTTEILSLFSDIHQRTIEVAKMVTTRSTGQTLTYYFFKAGPFIGSNYIKMRLSIASNKLAMNDTRGSLIRISTTLTPGNELAAKSLLINFLENLLPYVQKSL
ncbi:MAG: EpsI family protein [Deltaproteobacteria bacterium]|uniref:exosortase C-terminal domain/associated protein EpsI n=1 Tax=Desulfobacula sp. TaxID=2593537 RepID=UPI0019BE1919|nr:EpsI family protein [Candidatus Desulfobacula maris]MBL6992789.1 EpsI family protein [Desulfobacula sp.]